MPFPQEKAPDELIISSGLAVVRRANDEKTHSVTQALATKLAKQPEFEVRTPDNREQKRRPGLILLGSREVRNQPHLDQLGLDQTKGYIRQHMPSLISPRSVKFDGLNVHRSHGNAFFEVIPCFKHAGQLIDEREELLSTIDRQTQAARDPLLADWSPVWQPAMTLVFAPFNGYTARQEPIRDELRILARTTEIVRSLLPFTVELEGATLLPEARPAATQRPVLETTLKP